MKEVEMDDVNLHGVLAPGVHTDPPRTPALRRRQVNMQCNSCESIRTEGRDVFCAHSKMGRNGASLPVEDVLEPPCELDYWVDSHRWVVTWKKHLRYWRAR